MTILSWGFYCQRWKWMTESKQKKEGERNRAQGERAIVCHTGPGTLTLCMWGWGKPESVDTEKGEFHYFLGLCCKICRAIVSVVICSKVRKYTRVYSASNQYSVLHASLALESKLNGWSYRGEQGIWLGWFLFCTGCETNKDYHKSLRESPGEPCWVRLIQCWVILFEVEIKIDLLFPDLSY